MAAFYVRHHYTFMKKLIILIGLVIILLVIGVALFWPRAAMGTTTIKLSGVAGTSFTGDYVRDRQRVVVSGVIPWSLHSAGISEFEFRKANPEDSFAFVAHYDDASGAHAEQSREVPSGVPGVRGKIQDHGLITGNLQP